MYEGATGSEPSRGLLPMLVDRAQFNSIVGLYAAFDFGIAVSRIQQSDEVMPSEQQVSNTRLMKVGSGGNVGKH